MEMNLEKKTLIFVGVLVVIALISFFLVGSWASQEENFVGTCQGLDNKKTTVTELMGVTAASSTAITLIPGDTGTPIAEQLADMSGYFLFILSAICLEKWMVTMTGMAAFKVLIPIACVILILALLLGNELCKSIGIRLFLVAIMLFAIIPVSGIVTEKIDASYEASVQRIIEDTEKDTQEIKDTVGDEKDDNAIEKLFNKVKGGAAAQVKKFEGTLSRMTEAIAVLIVTSCVIPVAVMAFFIWMIRLVTGVNIEIPKIRASKIIGKK